MTAMIGRVPVHPLADLFPLIEGEAFDRLVADVKANGLREKIVIWRGQILDGRNRFRALREAGVINAMRPAADLLAAHRGFFRNVDLPEAKLPDFVISANLNRRHLNESERALIAARLATLAPGRRKAASLPVLGEVAPHPGPLPGEDGERGVAPHPGPVPGEDGERGGAPHPGSLPAQDGESGAAGVTIAEAAELLRVSPRLVGDARVVAGVPALAGDVTAGAVSVSGAAGAVRAVVRDLGGDADPEAVYQAVKARIDAERQQKIADKKARRAGKVEALGGRIAAANAAMGGMIEAGARFGVILADPEWLFETWSEAGKDRAPENHYPCSSLEAIKARPVPELAAVDCVLLLWATAPMLPQALEVMAAWGFTYKTHVVWAKPVAGTGHWLRSRHELLLIGTRGAPPCPAQGTQWPSVIEAPRGAHSEKPDFAHRFAETFFPGVPKLEMNARAPRDGWTLWGAETPGEAVA